MRIFLLALWFGAIVFAVLELTGVSRFGELSRIPALVSFVLTLVVFVPFLASGFDWFSRFLLALPLSRARRKTFRSRHEAYGEADKKTFQAVRSQFIDAIEPEKGVPGVILAGALGAFGSPRAPWPSQVDWVPEWLRNAAQAVEDSVLLRILIPERSRTAASAMRASASSLDRFIRRTPAQLGELRRGNAIAASEPPALFVDFVTKLTGAIALVDATQTRTGLASDVQVWHSARYRPAEDDRSTTFRERHEAGPSTSANPQCEWREKMRQNPSSRVGDYDGRVLNLDGAALTSDPTSGQLAFLLLTTEACYAATEHSPQACKGPMEKLSDAAYDARWVRDPGELHVSRVAEGGERLNMLTVLATLVLTTPTKRGPARSILLTERAQGLRNGSGVLSTVGGVMNLHHDDEGGDTDSDGFADPRAAIAREIHEELGLAVASEDFLPTVLYTFNQRSRTRVDAEARGQLLTSLSFTAHLRLSLDEVRAHRVSTSKANGRYELEDLIQLELPYPSAKIVEQRGRDAANLDSAKKLARSALALVRRLDQAAMVAIAYASAEAYTIAATIAAFDEVWDEPWYRHPWSEDTYDGGALGRLARSVSSQIDERWMGDVAAVASRRLPVPD